MSSQQPKIQLNLNQIRSVNIHCIRIHLSVFLPKKVAKLQFYGIEGTGTNWFSSCLNRQRSRG